MADINKAKQLSSARKKLKEYQKNRKPKGIKEIEDVTQFDSLASSTHSSINDAFLGQIDNLQTNVPALQSYFTNESSTSDTAFFDDHPGNFRSFDVINYNNGIESKNVTDDENQIDGGNNFIENTNIIKKKALSETTKNDDEATVQQFEPGVKQEGDIIALKKISDNIIKLIDNKVMDDDSHSQRALSETTKNDDEATVQQFEPGIKQEGDIIALKKISDNIIKLIDNKVMDDDSHHIECEKKQCDEIYCTLKYENRVKGLKVPSEKWKQMEEKSIQLQEQLNYHEQTINLLVAEKTELSNLLLQSENLIKQKDVESNEYDVRLRTSISRVADLERELNILRTEKDLHKKSINENEEYVHLVKKLEILMQEKEEIAQNVSELCEKLSESKSENLVLQKRVENLTSQLSLSDVKIQQLSLGNSSQTVEELQQRIAGFELQVTELNDKIKSANLEKEQFNLQYQQYVLQLNDQLSHVAQRLEDKVEENEMLTSREQQLVKQIGDLEKILQRNQTEQKPFSNESDDISKKLFRTLGLLEKSEKDKKNLEEKYEFVITERDELFKELETKKYEVIQLEELMLDLRNEQPDTVKLLKVIESDKVAAARAVAQNQELKKQLEEMQDVFIKMSNDKLELTERLDMERYKNKDIQEKLNQFEGQIHTLSDAIEIKDRELVSMRQNAVELNKYMLQQNQLEDRLRHYEAHDHSAQALRNELQESYKRIQNLKSENENLKINLDKAKGNNRLEVENDEVIELRRTKEQLEQQVVLLQNVMDDHYEKTNVQTASEYNVNNDVDVITKADKNVLIEKHEDDEILSKEMAMRQLEEKFTKTMYDIANLQEEKQRLEHLVLQLQGETETIGEYITLYQHQRGILKQRKLESEEQIRQLEIDRTLIKSKLNQLNDLIKVLVTEKGIDETLISQKIDSNILCDEHLQCRQHPHKPQNGVQETKCNPTHTVDKIIELVNEIKCSNLVQSSEAADTFHPCPWCSGQLITV